LKPRKAVRLEESTTAVSLEGEAMVFRSDGVEIVAPFEGCCEVLLKHVETPVDDAKHGVKRRLGDEFLNWLFGREKGKGFANAAAMVFVCVTFFAKLLGVVFDAIDGAQLCSGELISQRDAGQKTDLTEDTRVGRRVV